MPNALKPYLVLAAVAAVLAAPALAQPPAGGRTFEYAVVLEGVNGQRGVDQLNRAGAAGWDLASVVCTAQPRDCYYYMKRAK